MMPTYTDDVYGTVEIDEPVLLDLMQSAALQRLRGILQHGISGLIGVTAPITRYEHSLGVMLLVRRLGGALQEQIAALLHDVSHTAFSHVIDYVFDDHDGQSFHDEHKEAYTAKTEIPALLRAYGYAWRACLQEEAFALLEQPSPRLCADRLDYFLRDSRALGLASDAEIEFVLQHLVVADGRIVTDDLTAARWLGKTFIAADDASWANFQEVGLYELTAQAIRHALETGVITHDDIWGTDAPLWARLHAAEDDTLQALLRLITPATRFAWDAEQPSFTISTKLRTIDPDVWINGRLQPLSALDAEFARFRAEYLTRKAGKWPMRVVGKGIYKR